MKYNPDIHNRRSIRLKGYDYSQEGLYFITICVQSSEHGSNTIRPHLFGYVDNDEMVLNNFGKIASQCWDEIPNHFPNAILHEYIIMPNHIHGIIELVGAQNFAPKNSPKNTSAQTTENTFKQMTAQTTEQRAKNISPLQTGTIGSVVRGFKIGVTKHLGYSIWQRNYYEHIIRNEQSYQLIANYIISNPANWEKDKFYDTGTVTGTEELTCRGDRGADMAKKENNGLIIN